MIRINELRIGNWVNWDSGATAPDRVVQLTITDFEDSVMDGVFNAAFLIPINPEILIRCGFKETRKNYWTFNEYSMLKDAGGWHFDYVNADNRGDRSIAYPESLHQLQNLYFALTGTELNYNP